jgi:hypothetical protein
MSFRDVHPLKAPMRIVPTFVGTVTLVRAVQFIKAPTPILVTELGISMDDREHPTKVAPWIVVIELGIVTCFRARQQKKAASPICVTLSGMVNDEIRNIE